MIVNPVDNKRKKEEKKSFFHDTRSIKLYRRNSDENNSDDERNDIADVVCLPDISNVKRKDDKFYQHRLPIGNGIYDGTVNEKFLREGQGIFSINNKEEYYSGSWKDDQYNGYGFNTKTNGSMIYYGEFENGILKEGYGKVRLRDGYEYEGKIKYEDKIKDVVFHGLGSLSIKIEGLKEINSLGVEKNTLKLVADWEKGQTRIVYVNGIEEYYKYQYQVFCDSLASIISLNNENRQEQRQCFQNLIDLYDKRLSSLNLLIVISKHSMLPRALKSSADLLYKLDHSYTKLKKYSSMDTNKSYDDCVKDICQTGLKIYARRLARFEDESKIDCISSKKIFHESLNNFENKSELFELKDVLHLNPLVIDLIRKLICFANEKLIHVSSQNRSHFIDIHIQFLESIWMDYFKKYDQIVNISDYVVDEKYHFYSHCYSNLLELSLINQFEIEIKFLSLEIPENNDFITIKLNEEIIFRTSQTDTNRCLNVIVFDRGIGTKKSERSFNIDENSSELIHFIEKEIDPNDITAILASNDMNIEAKNFFKKLGSTEIENLKEKINWIFLVKNGKKIDEKISSNIQEELLIKQNFLFTLKEEGAVKDIDIKNKIELIVYKAIKFCLENLKPWKDFQTKEWSMYFNEHIDQDTSIKKIGDQLLIKILQDIKKQVLDYVKTNKNSEDINQFSNDMEIMIVYYQNSLLKDKNLNYQIKMKEIIKIFDYLLQISENKNSKIKDIIDLQLESIKSFIQEKETITEIIDHFLHFNTEFCKLSQSFHEHFPCNIHEKFHQNSSEIISLLTEISKMIVEKEKIKSEEESMLHKSQLLKDYNTNNLGVALQGAVENENKLYAMQKINSFLTNLGSLDMNWFVQYSQIENFDLNSSLFEKVGENNIYKVLNIETAKHQVKDPCPHYVLQAIKELLEIIKDVKIINRVTHTEMIKLKAELIMEISKSFKYFNDQIKYADLAKFKEDCVNPFKDVTKDNESYQIFCEKLEKIDLFFLYNRKLKEITFEQASKLFKEKNTIFFSPEIKNTFLKYEQSFNDDHKKIFSKEISIKDITEKTKGFANESNFNKDKIPDIIAGLSIILSLTASDFIEKKSNGEYELKDKYNENYLLQPHCIQILSVLMLLDMNENTDLIPPNHLAEILTGQGKSWALALLAGFFSLIGYQITVSCYSDYLSRRDEKDFKKNLDPFNFTNNVIYQTFESMCNDKLSNKNNNKPLRELVSTIVSGKELSPITSTESENEKSILLIDEVDVFFSNNFGNMYYPIVTIENKNLAKIQKAIWEELMNGNHDKTKLKNLAEEIIYSSIKNDKMLFYLHNSDVLKPHIEEMINTAIQIDEDNEKIFEKKYKIIEDKIYVKDSDGKYVKHIFNRYENSFYYLKLKYEETKSFEHVELNETNFGYLLIRCGTISYSELPNSYNGIFGVTGSLKDLTSAEESLLTYYKINKRSYYPSFFGHSKLEFDKSKNFLITEGEKDWFNSITTSARKKIAKDRSVLIFFDNEELLEKFFQSCAGDLGVTLFFITQNKIFDGKEEKAYSDSDVNKLIKDEYAGHHGKITLLTKEFGRGVDFQAETKVNKNGGIHVIQTFFSINIKEEIQIKGRTARKDEPGSYELILCVNHLQQLKDKLGKTIKFENITKDTTYDELDKQRIEKTNLFCQDKLKQIEKNKESHQRTLDFFKKALTECNENNREDFIKEIMQL